MIRTRRLPRLRANTRLRYDTPTAVSRLAWRMDVRYRGTGEGITLAWGLFAAVVAAGALLNGDYPLAVAAIAVVGWMGWWGHRRHVLARTLPRYRVLVHVGAGQVDAAHGYYHRLTPEHREVAAPLLEALYRLAGTEVAEYAARRVAEARMGARVDALRQLVQAEDRERLVAARYSLDDRDDLDGLDVWREAVAEVEARLGPLR